MPLSIYVAVGLLIVSFIGSIVLIQPMINNKNGLRQLFDAEKARKEQ